MASPSSRLHAELFAAGKGAHRQYEILLTGLPSEAHWFVSMRIEDFDTPCCRAQRLKTEEGILQSPDIFLKQLLGQGLSLTDLASGSCPFVHLQIANIPLSKEHQQVGSWRIELSNSLQLGVIGRNSGGSLGFYPPRPPTGDTQAHRYILHVFLHDHPLQLSAGFDSENWDQAQQNVGWAAEAEGVLNLKASDVQTK